MKQPPTGSTTSHYVPRTVGGWSETDIVAWASGKGGLTKDGDIVNRRIFSIIGPPGSGKTTFLRRLEDLLNQEPNVFALYLDLSATVDTSTNTRDEQANKILHDALRGALEARTAADEGVFRKLFELYDDTVSFPRMLSEAIRHLCRQDYLVVLLVDQIDDVLLDEWQFEIERNIIVPSLYLAGSINDTDCTRVIIARREETKLSEPQLKWEDTPGQLEPLTDDQPNEQIRRRLDELAKTGPSGFEQLEKDLAIGPLGLSDTKIREIIGFVNSGQDKRLLPPAEHLTGNPLVNLRLLYQSFLNDGERPISTEELNQVLEAYWQRAGLADGEHAKLRQVFLNMIRGWGADEPNWNPSYWSQVDYAILYNNGRVPFSIDELAPAFMAGVIQMVEMTRRYQLDPTLISLAKGAMEQPPGPSDESAE